MGAQRRLAWINRGSPFRLMTPLAHLRDRLRGYGYTVYDIGNRSHLEHDPPEDHTPYSATGYPGEADYGVGYAIDIMPPPARSGLPSLQRLGGQLLADRKAGVPGIRWLKYMNWEPERDNGGPCFKEAWRPTYVRTASTDRGHIHLSGLTGYETSTIAAGYDPVARIRGEDDMANFTDKHAATLDRLAALLPTLASQAAYTDARVEAMASGRAAVRADLLGGGSPVWSVQAIRALVDGLGQIDDQVAVQLRADLARIEAQIAEVGDPDPAAIAAAIPPELARQVADELARRLGADTAPQS